MATRIAVEPELRELVEHEDVRVKPRVVLRAVPARPRVAGRFLFVGEEKLWIKGVTYGAFRPDERKNEYHDLAQIERDFAQMAAAGINTVRIPHTTPPRALLDIAERYGLWVMVGLSAEQYVGYLIDRKNAPDVAGIVRAKVRAIAAHPALLCYAIGNEIPAPVARWIGKRRIEAYLEEIYLAIKDEDTHGLVTYVNYPTTEYLELPFLDLVAMNVYLEEPAKLAAYLARLQNLVGDRPLLLTEAGLDSLRNGQDAQAHALDWQIRTIFAAGASGAIVFSWTDEWWRAGAEVEDWAFGITDKQRRPKKALACVAEAFAKTPFADAADLPRISIVVCTYNGARTIRDTMEGILRLDYPDFETIVVNDGSTDTTPEIAKNYPVRLISTENRGLAAARNTGLEAASGEIVAYIDDDAWPDPDWLRFLAHTFRATDHAGIGGPNLPPPGDGEIAECVGHAPGGPVHVLLSDTVAEHIPGCNMAFRRDRLLAIGGFDPIYRAAGDDVDVCWRLMQKGWTLGFAAPAMVWHHRRNSVRAYWKQQKGYGKAEALLERKWPEKYNGVGHLTWGGRIYGGGVTLPLFMTSRVYHGVWGSAPYQSGHKAPMTTLAALPLMPEWYLIIAALAFVSVLGLSWSPLLAAVPLLALAVAAPVGQALLSAARSVRMTHRRVTDRGTPYFFALTAALHLLQPIARLLGRLKHGLAPWRNGVATKAAAPRPRHLAIWTETWAPPETRIEFMRSTLGSDVLCGGPFDRWDLALRGGLFGGARLLVAVEDHGAGNQYVRVRAWPRPSFAMLATAGIAAALAVAAALAGAKPAAIALAIVVALIGLRMLRDCGAALGRIVAACHKLRVAIGVKPS